MNKIIAVVVGVAALMLPAYLPATAQPPVEPPVAEDSHGNGLCRALPADTEEFGWAMEDDGDVVAFFQPDGPAVKNYGPHPCYAAQKRVAWLEQRRVKVVRIRCVVKRDGAKVCTRKVRWHG